MKTSHTISITLIVLVAALAINWVRAGEGFSIARTIPLLGGYRPSFYDIAGVALIVWAAYRVARMMARASHGRDDVPENGGLGHEDGEPECWDEEGGDEEE